MKIIGYALLVGALAFPLCASAADQSLDLTFKCDVAYQTFHPTSEQTRRYRDKLQADNKIPKEVIDQLVTRFSDGHFYGNSQEIYLHSVSAGDAVKFSRSAKLGGPAGAIDYLDANLNNTGLPAVKGGLEYNIVRSSFYASPNTVGEAFLPWYLGIFTLDKLFDKASERRAVGDSVVVRQKFHITKTRSVTIEALIGPDGRPSKMQTFYGIGKEPYDVCTIDGWETQNGVTAPRRVIVNSFDVRNSRLYKTLTVNLISARPAAISDIADLASLGPKGATVEDCRFGNDQCVQYAIGDRVLTDAEVQDLISKKERRIPMLPRRTEVPSESSPILMITGLGIAGVAGLGWLCVRMVAPK